MLNTEKLQSVLEGYKKYFPAHFAGKYYEKFKWEAVQYFQDHWDIEAEDFGKMFKISTSKTANLLSSGFAYPKTRIIDFAKADCEAIRKLFVDLYDESRDLAERVEEFQNAAEKIFEKYNDGSWKDHDQKTNAISTYLWLRYPDKYFIYKYQVCKDTAAELEFDRPPKRDGSVTSMLNSYAMYEEICEAIKKDADICRMVRDAITNTCWQDTEFHTTAIDIGFYINRFYLDEKKEKQKAADPVPKDEPADTGIIGEDANPCPPYTREDFLRTVFMTAERYDVLAALLRNKKNVILQGAPGVGKTFTAKKLAYAMMGVMDDSRIEMVQFHQNYSYEDFIMGYRPDGADFKLTEGIFYQFCQTASNHPEQEYFFIIDEINRGNLSKIFGELLMMIEKDYRGTKVKLAYDGRPFSVPENLYIIGMMNTADRSLAMIDYALRRRFSFFEMEPGFNSDGFTEYQKALADETFDELIGQIRLLNKEIAEDNALGRGFQIGHSYFCGREEEGCTDEWMRSVVEFDILPMLGEYWFDEPAKLRRWEKNLRGVFDD